MTFRLQNITTNACWMMSVCPSAAPSARSDRSDGAGGQGRRGSEGSESVGGSSRAESGVSSSRASSQASSRADSSASSRQSVIAQTMPHPSEPPVWLEATTRMWGHAPGPWPPQGRRPEPSPAHVVPEDHPPAWHSLKPRAREPSWSPEPPPSPVRGPHGVLPPRLRASQETLETTKDWPPPPPGVELDQLEAPPPPRAFMPGTWSPRPEHLPLTAATAVSGSRGDPRSPGALAAAAVAGGGPVIYDDHHLVRHAADCPAHRLVTKQECDRSSSRPASRPSSRPASRQGSRTTSRPASRSASRSGSRSASRSGHRSGYSSPGSDLR